MTLSKLIVLIVSLLLALAFVGTLFPKATVASGGAGEMIAVIFLTVVFKAVIEYFLARRRKKREAKDLKNYPS